MKALKLFVFMRYDLGSQGVVLDFILRFYIPEVTMEVLELSSVFQYKYISDNI